MQLYFSTFLVLLKFSTLLIKLPPHRAANILYPNDVADICTDICISWCSLSNTFYAQIVADLPSWCSWSCWRQPRRGRPRMASMVCFLMAMEVGVLVVGLAGLVTSSLFTSTVSMSESAWTPGIKSTFLFGGYYPISIRHPFPNSQTYSLSNATLRITRHRWKAIHLLVLRLVTCYLITFV